MAAQMDVGDGGAPELVAVGRSVGARNMGGANAREAKVPGIQGGGGATGDPTSLFCWLGTGVGSGISSVITGRTRSILESG